MSCSRSTSTSYSYSFTSTSSNGVKKTWTSTEKGSLKDFQTQLLETQQKFGQLEAPQKEQSASEFEDEALRVHNQYRATHGVAPLRLDRNLCKYADEWARNLAARGVMQHRGGSSPYGENLYCKYGSVGTDATAAEATKSWYDEIQQYNFAKPGFSGGTGHFTQVVWRGSERLGVAKARNAKGQVFIVANYDPPGNVLGQFPENVPRVGAPLKVVTAPKETKEPTKAASQVVSSSNSAFSAFERECLDAHNKYRAQHSTPPLKLNRKMCEFATEWARRLVNEGRMYHRPNNKYGENIYMKQGTGVVKVTGTEGVKAWYDEISMYSFSRPGFSMATGHFTQVVWAGSTEMGVGMAEKNGSIYVVANYDPPGNYQGQFPANVKPKSR